MVSLDPSIWVQAFFIIVIFSFAFRDNILFRFAEYTYIGVMMGYQVCIAIKFILELGIGKVATGSSVTIFPIILGILLYTRYFREYAWLSRWSISLIIGVMTGLYLSTIVQVQILKQISATFLPLTGISSMKAINNILIIILCIVSLYYFTFTGTLRERIPFLPKLGRYTIMTTLGVIFGGTIATRYSMFISQLQFLLYDWIGLAPK